jgi:cytidylate kinase
MAARDRQDADRAAAPLRPAADAVILDTTAMDADAAFQAAVAVVSRVLPRRSVTD